MSESLTEALNGLFGSEAPAIPERKENRPDVYQERQAAIKQTEEIQHRLLRGLKAGEPAGDLFLLAVEGLSLATGNELLLTEARRQAERAADQENLLELARALMESKFTAGQTDGSHGIELYFHYDRREAGQVDAYTRALNLAYDLRQEEPEPGGAEAEPEPEPAKTEPIRNTRTSSSRMEEFIYWQDAFRKIGVEVGADDPDPTVESLTGPLHVKAKTIERYCQDSGQYYIDGDRVRKKK